MPITESDRFLGTLRCGSAAERRIFSCAKLNEFGVGRLHNNQVRALRYTFLDAARRCHVRHSPQNRPGAIMIVRAGLSVDTARPAVLCGLSTTAASCSTNAALHARHGRGPRWLTAPHWGPGGQPILLRWPRGFRSPAGYRPITPVCWPTPPAWDAIVQMFRRGVN